MSKFKSLHQSLSMRLSLPEDALHQSYRLQVFSGYAILSGCRKLLKYNSEEIAALTKEGTVRFLGAHLKCKYFFEGTVELCGESTAINSRFYY